MGRCSKKRARQNTISINTVPLLSVRHSKKICVHKNDSKIKNNRTVNEFPWPYQWTGCVGPPDQTREGEE
ncbi:hypothetical protein SERLA73DRAFT_192506 [Serpula lacrymans var. lacrymans S7.3]|uniref:Uncharacterized protein n=1 Tax=Serpula lacrymans var. lacrymans (strain S7.3) TaxID=936435 RepID=F8QKV7_SERL3|nr:hypothetical protein SERLA73DRAFT_192506 [Serpula lacrymans var. lacrymans S7.3]